jgi:type II secretory pathway predicted ATPase ExeA
MFKAFYGLSKNPFDKQSLAENDAFMSKDHREMTSRLLYLNNIRGVGVFTSPPGFGKTYALRCFAKTIDRNLNDIVYLCLATVKLTEFYRQFCSALGIDPPHGKAAMFRDIQERLHHLCKEKKRPLILIFDEAHELCSSILKDIKMIMNSEFDSLNCFTLVLAGEPHLNNILQKPIHEALRQRIVIHYNFSGLSDDETEQYLRHKLRIAGATDSILGNGTLPAIIGYAHGCSRLIDNLMIEALNLGAQQQKSSLDTDTITRLPAGRWPPSIISRSFERRCYNYDRSQTIH